MNNNDSFSDSSDCEYFEYSSIEDFLENETENVIDLFHDLKNRFPYFLGDRSEKLTEFIIDNIYEVLQSKNNKVDNYKLTSFIKNNRNEISVTLNVLNRFLATRTWNRKNTPKTKTIKESNWITFCFIDTL